MSKLLTLRLTDYDDACGTNGGDAFMEITALTESGTEISTFRYDLGNDDRADQLTVENAYSTYILSERFQNHMHLAVCAMSVVFAEFARLSKEGTIEGYFTEVFMQNDIDALHYEITWNVETNEVTLPNPPIAR